MNTDAIAEKLYKQCPACNGDGYTSEHDNHPHTHGCEGRCPVQAQCKNCMATGYVEFIPSSSLHEEIERLIAECKKAIEQDQSQHEIPMGSFNRLVGRLSAYEHILSLYIPNTEEVKEPSLKIDVMVNRFLQWELPSDFMPDGGVTFDKKSKPVGTNLLTYTQAKQMIEFMLSDLPIMNGKLVYPQQPIEQEKL